MISNPHDVQNGLKICWSWEFLFFSVQIFSRIPHNGAAYRVTQWGLNTSVCEPDKKISRMPRILTFVCTFGVHSRDSWYFFSLSRVKKVSLSARSISGPAGGIGSLPSLGMVRALTIPRDGKASYHPAKFSCTQFSCTQFSCTQFSNTPAIAPVDDSMNNHNNSPKVTRRSVD